MYVRVRKNGTTFTGQYSKDGDTWTTLATVTVTLPSIFDVGIAATSHDTASFVTAIFEEPTFEP
jgi:regulation of enolase protein 1 (concanavalin A-like superfamily)